MVHAEESLQRYAPPDFALGGVLHGDRSFRFPEYRAVAKREFNTITATAYMPWGTWPDPTRKMKFGDFTAVVDWSVAAGKRVHGHTLLFPKANQQLDWWTRLPTSSVEPLLSRYVTSLASIRAGKVWLWDVVNEVMANDGEPMDGDGLRTDLKEYRAMGPRYVDKVFAWAHAADPNAVLILNEAGCDQLNSKSTRLLNYATKLRDRGVPIHGIGFQFHFVDIRSPDPDAPNLRANLQRFADSGFEIYITEMDACAIQTRDPSPKRPGVTTPNAAQLRRQQLFFQETLRVALLQPACKGFMLWDFADDHSWLHKSDSQVHTVSPGDYTYPTPFWCGKVCPIKPKPAYNGMLEALKSTPRPTIKPTIKPAIQPSVAPR